ncbi:hypothetical protein CEUSTIGMA_g4228.t1 [Chlamydomonas eustigma]|uniref:histidine kinase n=1 Tax=Chlamydomonas eustigma TaxID=1157962 RepID=A0A250X1L5_9CHLO|nr:hypothetical protein CEUSTIGMA_g4228.t1 [Chlamydomonas eustigma]|eukprot:GAX76782.1 hypothetical protein CEUSTIGMA_g4228.t1 [Chlamydomonas eustigma]
MTVVKESAEDVLVQKNVVNAADLAHANAHPTFSISPRICFAYLIVSFGSLSFFTISLIVCTVEGNESSDISLNKAGGNIYLAASCCFATAFTLNILTMAYERDNQKFQLALLGAYIQLLAGSNDFLSFLGCVPMMPTWSAGDCHVLRMIMWAHTTPAMIYLLSLLSEFSPTQVWCAVAADILMILSGLLGDILLWIPLSVLMTTVSFACFPYVLYMIWLMFETAISQVQSHGNKANLESLKHFTLGLWTSFPLLWLIVRTGLISFQVEEGLWTICDFLGKIMFSSSLLYGNFVTIEERRLVAMKAVEDGNRIQVIKELEELVEKKEGFMSSVSHELRTPLNGIIGLSDALIIGSCGEVNDSVRKTVSTIKTSGCRLLNLINDILDAAAMKRGKLVVKLEKVDLAKLVDDVVDLCSPLAKKGVRMLNNVPSRCPPVVGDSGRIIQIFHNLIGNSCKFTHHGKIWIETSDSSRSDGQIEVAVHDNGIGIPSDKFEQIFQAFEQVDLSTTQKYGGTGLGLSLVKQLVEAHGGTVHVESKMGHGTSFIFTLKKWVDEDPKSPLVNNGYKLLDRYDAPSGGIGGSFLQRMGSLSRTSQSVNNAADNARDAAFSTAVETNTAAKSASRAMGSGISSLSRFAAQSSIAYTVSEEETLVASSIMRGRSMSLDIRSRSPAPGAAHDVFNNMPASAKKLWRNGPIRVLSVDDDPVNQLVIQNLLEPEGYEILQAMDGQEALNILSSLEMLPDVILLDVMMPGMSGYEVCRKIQELYPLNCLPIIMVSAKSKEENIVEGLVAGSNDYLVKPFGRKEILARIQAHLRFRNMTYHAGEIAGEAEGRAARYQSLSGHLVSDLITSSVSMQYSLPNCIKSKIENTTFQADFQTFDHLCVMVASISNIDTLVKSLHVDDLIGALTSLYIYMDELLLKTHCYLVDCVEGQMIVVSGLSGETLKEQASNIVDMAGGLLRRAESIQMSGGLGLELSIGIHAGQAQGVVVGVQHPVMFLTGGLPETASRLQASSPANCIHVSAQFKGIHASPDSFARALNSTLHGDTYLYKAGSWEERAILVTASYERYLSQHPFGPINTSAVRLKPIQQALMVLIASEPGVLFHLLSVTEKRDAQSDPSAQNLEVPLRKLRSSSRNNLLVAQLQHEKEVLERQLEEVSEECNRLQNTVDTMELELLGMADANSRADSARAEAALLRLRAERAEVELITSRAERSELLDHLDQVEGRLMVLYSPRTSSSLSVAAGMEAHHRSLSDWSEITGSALRRQLRNPVPRGPSALGMGVLRVSRRQLTGSPSSSQLLTDKGSPCGSAASGGTSMLGSYSIYELRLADRFRESPASKSTHNTSSSEQVAFEDDPDVMKGMLLELGLEAFVPSFQSKGVTPGVLRQLDEAGLRELGVTTVGARLKLRAVTSFLARRESEGSVENREGVLAPYSAEF